MIISASRRTDIPAFHAEWMMNRLRAGYALVRNPYNARQISRVSLLPGEADAIVFWTKNAQNMLPHLSEIEDMGHKYLFQYTLTPYGNDIERNIDKRRAQEALLRLAERIGKERVIWRYDPILLSDEWTAEKHVRAFDALSRRLEGATGRCVISFVDLYARLKRSEKWIKAPSEEEMHLMACEIASMARARGMIPSACAEQVDLTGEGIEARGCIDKEDIGRLLGARVASLKDAGQRSACRCMPSVDIGCYDTCGHECAYCYAKTRRGPAVQCGVHSPVLGAEIGPEDRITERREKKILLSESEQTSLF